MRSFPAFLLLAVIATMALPAAASSAPARFSAQQRVLITDYAREQARVTIALYATYPGDNLGFAHPSDNSPHFVGMRPGVSRSLTRGKQLPLVSDRTRLPDTLVRTLPPLPDGHEIVVMDGRVLLVDVATQRIRDRLVGVIVR